MASSQKVALIAAIPAEMLNLWIMFVQGDTPVDDPPFDRYLREFEVILAYPVKLLMDWHVFPNTYVGPVTFTVEMLLMITCGYLSSVLIIYAVVLSVRGIGGLFVKRAPDLN